MRPDGVATVRPVWAPPGPQRHVPVARRLAEVTGHQASVAVRCRSTSRIFSLLFLLPGLGALRAAFFLRGKMNRPDAAVAPVDAPGAGGSNALNGGALRRSCRAQFAPGRPDTGDPCGPAQGGPQFGKVSPRGCGGGRRRCHRSTQRDTAERTGRTSTHNDARKRTPPRQ